MPHDADTEIRRLQGICKAQAKEIKRLRDALGPFACLGRNELRPGDFNRARRALAMDRKD